MPFPLGHLRRVGNSIRVSIPGDEHGFIGRECPQKDCEGYFKVKPGTGLTGAELTCSCPYCGHTASPDQFWTQDQIKYAKSVAFRRITDAFHQDLKSVEFDHKPDGLFGLGISLKVESGVPHPIRYYREKELETNVVCLSCTLHYSVFGVFAYCPDCAVHNSAQILDRNMELIRRQVSLAEAQNDSDLSRHLLEDALENVVSAFDGFGRESCRIRASRSADPERSKNISFQHLPRAAKNLQRLFNVIVERASSHSDCAGTTC